MRTFVMMVERRDRVDPAPAYPIALAMSGDEANELLLGYLRHHKLTHRPVAGRVIGDRSAPWAHLYDTSGRKHIGDVWCMEPGWG